MRVLIVDDHPIVISGCKALLAADPKVEVQVKGDRFKATARTASAEEKPEMWKTMVSEWPDYDEYQSNTTREIPIVVLERDAS